MASSMPSHQFGDPGRSASMARGVNALDTSLRSLVWSGGSRSSMDTALARGASSPPYSSSRICRSRLSAAILSSSTDRPGARSSQDTSL